MSRRVRLILFVALGIAMTIAIVLLLLYVAARHEPAFYRRAMEIEPAVLEKASDRMLQQATALASAVKHEGHWEALFTAEQINGWLAVDMAQNHPTALPPMLHDPRVAITPREITIACRFEQGGVDTVLSLTVEPYVSEPNVVALRIIAVRAGLVPAPLGGLLERLKDAGRGMPFRLSWLHADGDPVAVLSFPAGDDRPMRIETLRLGDGEIYIAGTTQAKKP